MNTEDQILELTKKVAVLESRTTALEAQLNGLGETLRSNIKDRLDEPLYGIEPRLCAAERNIFKAQIYTGAVAATATTFILIIQYLLTSVGVSIWDVLLRTKK